VSKTNIMHRIWSNRENYSGPINLSWALHFPHRQLIQDRFPLLPIGQAAGEQLIELCGMVVFDGVAELVHDDVVDAVEGDQDQIEIE
jgi:hypothetical protein